MRYHRRPRMPPQGWENWQEFMRQTQFERMKRSQTVADNKNDRPQLTSLKPAFIKWDDDMLNKTVSGRIVGKNFVELRDGSAPRYTLETDNGRVAFLAPQQVAEMLDGLRMGTYVEVTYLGEGGGNNGRRKYKEFDIKAETDAVVANPETGEILEPDS